MALRLIGATATAGHNGGVGGAGGDGGIVGGCAKPG